MLSHLLSTLILKPSTRNSLILKLESNLSSIKLKNSTKRKMRMEDLYTQNTQITKHEVVSACFVAILNDVILNDVPETDKFHKYHGKPFMFKGEDETEVIKQFVAKMVQIKNELDPKDINYEIDRDSLTLEQQQLLANQTHCLLSCGTPLKSKYKNNSHLHHDHLRPYNNVIGYACKRCNLQMTEARRKGIPVIFHNGAKYDWRLLMKRIGEIVESQSLYLERS